MRLVRVLVGLAVLLPLPLHAAAQKGGARPSARSVFVSVVDSAGAPVLDLSPGDFDVTENGERRTVTAAALAKSPMRIVLLVDTSDGAAAQALNHIRTGLVAFLDAVPPPHEVMIVSTGRQTRVRVPPTADRKKLKDAANGLFPDGGATVLSDTLLEMDDRFLRKAEDRWPVFVIITSDGTEGSAGANEKKLNDWARAIPARGIAAHALVLKFKGGGTPEVVANQVAQNAGGYYDFINTSNSIPDKMKAIADRLMSDFARASVKYQVTFASDSQTAPVTVGVARSGVRVATSYGRLR